MPVKNVYTIEVQRLVWHQTALDITVMKATTNANVTIELPNVVQNSSNPLQGGSFRIKCVDPDGFWSFSTELNYMSTAG